MNHRNTNDVSAILLTMGESFTPRALKSLQDQTCPPAEVVRVDNVFPFYRAFNEGAAQITTRFFVQADADMVLDPICLEHLRSLVQPDTGIVAGRLRDPLMGTIEAVKLFRTECFHDGGFGNTISPDYDYHNNLYRKGWQLIYAVRHDGLAPADLHTFGQHLPEYTPLYTYSKFILDGQRKMYRGKIRNHHKLFWRIAERGHPAALMAQIAMVHGVFLPESGDGLKPFEPTPDFERAQTLLAGSGHFNLDRWDFSQMLSRSSERVFTAFFRLGAEIAEHHSPSALRECLARLEQIPRERAWPATLALCHGLFFTQPDRTTAEQQWRQIAHHFPS